MLYSSLSTGSLPNTGNSSRFFSRFSDSDLNPRWRRIVAFPLVSLRLFTDQAVKNYPSRRDGRKAERRFEGTSLEGPEHHPGGDGDEEDGGYGVAQGLEWAFHVGPPHAQDDNAGHGEACEETESEPRVLLNLVDPPEQDDDGGGHALE